MIPLKGHGETDGLAHYVLSRVGTGRGVGRNFQPLPPLGLRQFGHYLASQRNDSDKPACSNNRGTFMALTISVRISLIRGSAFSRPTSS